MIVLRTTNGRRSTGWVRRLLLGLIAGIVATAAGCSSSAGDREAVSAAPIASGQESFFRFESLTDRVSYADAVAIVNIASEDVLPLEEPEQTERLVGRSVAVEFEDVLWGNGPPGGEATIIGQGWFENVDEGTRRPFVPTEGPRYEVGRRYVVAFVEWPYESEAALISPTRAS